MVESSLTMSRRPRQRFGEPLARLPGRRAVRAVLEWYFETAYGVVDGPGVLPFYCDPRRVGQFAVPRNALAAGEASAIFRLFIALTMFQARRDSVIMDQQRGMRRQEAQSLASPAALRRVVIRSQCPTLENAARFQRECDVMKKGAIVDCAHRRGAPCHVKDATTLLNRMGDMGKLPTSAWLRLFKDGDVVDVVNEISAASSNPRTRARLLVEWFAQVHRVGRKLATMFVSALSTPGLAPELTPWFPQIDGYELVVVDTNVARAVAALRAPSKSPATYDNVVRWIHRQARFLDLRAFNPSLPNYAPRIVQQALYVFCSKSNRAARGDSCAGSAAQCARCVPQICPFRRAV